MRWSFDQQLLARSMTVGRYRRFQSPEEIQGSDWRT